MGSPPAAPLRIIGRGLWGPTIELADGTLLKLVRRTAGIGDGREICANEARVLRLLSGDRIGTLAVPRLISHGTFAAAAGAAGAGFAAWLHMTRVPGRPFDESMLSALSAHQRDRFAASLGRAMAELQSGARRIAGGRLDTLDLRAIVLLKALADASSKAADRAICDDLAAAVDTMPAGRLNHFVHADAHLENLMVGDDGIVCGLVDFAESGRGFPEIDLAYLHWLPEIAEPARRAFAAVAGAIDERSYQLAGAIYALTGAVIAERRGGPGDAAEDRALLESCLARAGQTRV